MVYARAVSQWLLEIEEGGLSQQEGAVAMLLPPPTLFVIEPFITTELMQARGQWEGTVAISAPPPALRKAWVPAGLTNHLPSTLKGLVLMLSSPHSSLLPSLAQLIRGPGGAVVPPAAAQPFPSSAADPARAALEARLHWPAESNQWVEVVAHLVGEAGKVRTCPYLGTANCCCFSAGLTGLQPCLLVHLVLHRCSS